MILHSTDKIPVGKYQGMNIGLLYLLSPKYIDWMIARNQYSSICIGDLDFLQSLKVINRFGRRSFEAHETGVDLIEFREFWIGKIDFEEVKYSGYEYFEFSSEAVEKNQKRLRNYSDQIKPRTAIPEAERELFIYYPGTGKSSNETTFTPTGISKNKKGLSVVSFITDNDWGEIGFLPWEKTLKVSSFLIDTWNISVEELNQHILKKEPIKGRIEDGFLSLG